MTKKRRPDAPRGERFVWKEGDLEPAGGMRVLYSIYTAAEGGFEQEWVITLLRGEGIRATPATSPYVGQTGVVVFGGKREQKKAERILYSY